MKFLCLICAETVMEYMPPEEAAAQFEEYRALIEDLTRSGHYVGCNRLQPRETAVTVRVRNGKATTTDGPFAETKEQLGGYFVLEARDMAEALRIAARIPGARYGSVEVRPVADDEATLRLLKAGAAATPA